jgi:hypothetical protein
MPPKKNPKKGKKARAAGRAAVLTRAAPGTSAYYYTRSIGGPRSNYAASGALTRGDISSLFSRYAQQNQVDLTNRMRAFENYLEMQKQDKKPKPMDVDPPPPPPPDDIHMEEPVTKATTDTQTTRTATWDALTQTTRPVLTTRGVQATNRMATSTMSTQTDPPSMRGGGNPYKRPRRHQDSIGNSGPRGLKRAKL